MELPETRYVNSGGVHLAYQVIGEGPIDLLVVAEAFSFERAGEAHTFIAERRNIGKVVLVP